MAVDYQQTDTATDCTAFAACSGASLNSSPIESECDPSGSAGSTPATTGAIATSSSEACLYMQSIGGQPNETSWPAGTWTVRFNVTTSNMNVDWNEVYVCRVSNACSNLATVGSSTGLGISLGTTGVKSTTVSGSSQTANATDYFAIVFVFTNNDSMKTQTVGITRDQLISTPFAAPAIPIIPIISQRVVTPRTDIIDAHPKHFPLILPSTAAPATANPVIGQIRGQLLEDKVRPLKSVPKFLPVILPPAAAAPTQPVIRYNIGQLLEDRVEPLKALPQFFPVINPTIVSYFDYECSFQYDPTQYSPSATVYFEIVMKVTGAPLGYARLYNETDGSEVSGSGLSTASGTFVRLRTSALTLDAAAKDYKAQVGLAGGTVDVCGARLIIQQ